MAKQLVQKGKEFHSFAWYDKFCAGAWEIVLAIQDLKEEIEMAKKLVQKGKPKPTPKKVTVAK